MIIEREPCKRGLTDSRWTTVCAHVRYNARSCEGVRARTMEFDIAHRTGKIKWKNSIWSDAPGSPTGKVERRETKKKV